MVAALRLRRMASCPGTFLGPSGVVCAHGHIMVIDSMGVRGKVLQLFSATHESLSARAWIRLPRATRLVSVGATCEGVYLCDCVSSSEGALYRAPVRPGVGYCRV